ncbi:fucolectin-7-like [Argopecten irradians]|uniref:fucolectin-7-like n=1 Tax=Argopecten irradians TaxID=31199 RepID=UPI00371E6ED6
MAKDKYLQSRNVVFLSLVFILATVRSEGNLALSKTATQSCNHSQAKWLAGAAVDGCQQRDINSDCCTHTEDDSPKTVWWRVDLGQISTIDSIQIIYRVLRPINSQGHVRTCQVCWWRKAGVPGEKPPASGQYLATAPHGIRTRIPEVEGLW